MIDGQVITVITANTQAGVITRGYGDYLLRAWHHVSPFGNPGWLESWARDLDECDFLALQEADSGSWRSSFQHQARVLSHRLGFEACHHQENRRLGRVLCSGNALLSRHGAIEVDRISFQGVNRGAIIAHYPCEDGVPLMVVNTHLSLSKARRADQVFEICRAIDGRDRVIVMGDFNAEPRAAEMEGLAGQMHCVSLGATHPSWKPAKCLDHIWVRGMDPIESHVRAWDGSDHLCVVAKLALPARLCESTTRADGSPPAPGRGATHDGRHEDVLE